MSENNLTSAIAPPQRLQWLFFANHLHFRKLSLTLHTSMKIQFLMKVKNRMKYRKHIDT
jgi:hypothetical protein